MSRLSNSQRILVSSFGFIVALGPIGCGPEFDPPSKLQSLRIVAVKKDDPYLRPAAASPTTGDVSSAASVDAATQEYQPDATAHLTVALEDARRSEDRQGPLQKLWFAGCNNPPNDNYFTCLLSIWLTFKVWTELGPYSDRGPGKLPDGEGWPNQEDFAQIGQLRFLQYFTELFPDLAAQASAGVEGQASQLSAFLEQAMALRIGTGDTFDYTVPAWVIERHPAPADTDLPRYGLSQVFFALCDGDIGISPGWETIDDPLEVLTDATRGFPLTCYERGTKKERGPDHFVVSYSNLYVYDELKNRNPIIDGFYFGDGDDRKVGNSAYCIGQACQAAPPRVCDGTAPRVDHCDPSKPGGCEKYSIQPIVDEALNREIDDNASRAGGGNANLREQLWIRYYADEGDVERDVKRLQDASEGWFAEHGTKWTPPQEGNRVAHIWAVVYDNRGGVDWVRVSVCVD